jgi:hypothetical protein
MSNVRPLRSVLWDSQALCPGEEMPNNDDLDEIYADTWNRRTTNLGGMSYAEYLKSDHWRSLKVKASRRPNYLKCEFCSSTDTELHHTSYKWIMTEQELRVIMSLCRAHHQEVHDAAKSCDISVRVATNLLRRKYKPDYRAKNRLPPDQQ